MMKTIARIESNHAKILEFERRRYERRIRKLSQQLDEERQKVKNLRGKNGERSAEGDEGGWTSVRDAQYRVAVMAESEQGKMYSNECIAIRIFLLADCKRCDCRI